ncbi:MAG: Zn-dependent alcohol dehydrogenase [Deltaproteobacteria bacterium]|nr:Zn-dependent alcohol dehydrogenase [Deltaproteobacteria bacterium]
MKAAVLTEAGKPICICDDIDLADPRHGEVRVRVKHCGICHSDYSLATGTFPAPVPVVLGHEAAGVIDAVGPGVTTHEVGDHVVLTPCPPCGHCYFCVRDEQHHCVNSASINSHTFLDGTTSLSQGGQQVYRGLGIAGFSEYTVMPASGAVKIPQDAPLDVACVIGCAVQTGVGAVLNTAQVEEGATVLVLGLGGIGLSVVQGAVLAGASRIIVSDPVEERRIMARKFGATDLLDPGQDEVTTACMDLTQVGVDYAFETAGSGPLAQTCFAAARPGGSIVAIGAAPLQDSIAVAPAALLTISGKKLMGCLLGSCNSLREIPRLVSLWQQGRLDLESLISHRRPLEEINEGFEDMGQNRGIRTVIDL